MRPEILFDLFSNIKILKGIHKARSSQFKRLAGDRVIDLVWHLPSQTQRRIGCPSIMAAEPGQLVTLKVHVGAHKPPPRGGRNRPYRVLCYDQTGQIDLIFFHAHTSYLESKLPIDQERVISGKVDLYNGLKTLTHPDHIGDPATYSQWVGFEPLYPLTHGITQAMVKKVIHQALAFCPNLPEWIPEPLLKKGHWQSWKDSLLKLHTPQSDADLDPISPARRRLAYDELLSAQLALQLIRRHHQSQLGQSLTFSQENRQKVLDSLPFQLTGDQQKALQDIDEDMKSSHRMVRLLQGDVGSGKTIVAFLAMLNAMESGGQAALMVPTEILARQHLKTLQPWADKAGLMIRCLTGQDKASTRRESLQKLKEGTLHLLVGTHALIQEDVLFKDLKMAVIDEQHRFGVDQRLKLSQKGTHTELLVMSATPIPRTLTMTVYGDLTVSMLREKPAGRKEIDTRLVDSDRLVEVVAGLERALSKEKKIYWICPLIEESEEMDVAAAEERYRLLQDRFGEDLVGLIHGRMTQAHKDKVMEDFLKGSLQILVSTTVIEVGIDVPDATIMIIEHAERFGLAQLHQLRGRIGRSELNSTCLLLYQKPLSDISRRRLETVRKTNDGFQIAEEDLRLRGGGEVLSSKQSGLPPLKIADYFLHQDLLLAAHEEAKKIITQDPCLQSERGKALKVLLYLFEQDQVVTHLHGG